VSHHNRPVLPDLRSARLRPIINSIHGLRPLLVSLRHNHRHWSRGRIASFLLVPRLLIYNKHSALENLRCLSRVLDGTDNGRHEMTNPPQRTQRRRRLPGRLPLRSSDVSTVAGIRGIAKEKKTHLQELGEKALEDPSIDKLVDQRTMAEADKGNVVIDGQLAGWILKDRSDLRIYLAAPEDIRLE